jgi:hypothetical protein
MRDRLRVETWECDEPSFTFAEITAFTSPTALTPSLWWPIRRWMILRIFMLFLFPTCKCGNLGSFFVAGRVQEGMGIGFPVPGVRLIRALDVAAAVWVVAWVVLALLVGREVRDLRQLSDTVVVAGVAVEETGDLVESLGSVPFIGGRVGEVAERVRTAGRSAQASGRDSRDSTENLSVLLALSIGLIPTLPLLGLSAPLRVTWAREARAVRRALAAGSADPVLKEFLARRAVLNLPYQELRAVSADPFRDLEDGRFDALAARELERLGIRGGSFSRRGEPGPIHPEETPE